MFFSLFLSSIHKYKGETRLVTIKFIIITLPLFIWIIESNMVLKLGQIHYMSSYFYFPPPVYTMKSMILALNCMPCNSDNKKASGFFFFFFPIHPSKFRMENDYYLECLLGSIAFSVWGRPCINKLGIQGLLVRRMCRSA